MTKEEFENGYCQRSGITVEEYNNEFNLITLPCDCGEDGCEGWAAVTNTPRMIEIHKREF
ncbi:hypothetical protein COE51_01295 [Bacillus pseudomycoides]|nr:hypothetical protein COE51_01295 [Bacillus pseudomycoides]